MGINIGNNNNINNSVINDGVINRSTNDKQSKTWCERHSVLLGILGSLFVGILLMFGFWKDLISFVEGLF